MSPVHDVTHVAGCTGFESPPSPPDKSLIPDGFPVFCLERRLLAHGCDDAPESERPRYRHFRSSGTWRTEHPTRTLVGKLDFVTAAGGFHGVVTPIAVFIKREGRLALQSWHPEATLDEVRSRTGFDFDANGSAPTPPPTQPEIEALRALDPEGRFEHDARVKLR
jgi:hypothetical protein